MYPKSAPNTPEGALQMPDVQWLCVPLGQMVGLFLKRWGCTFVAHACGQAGLPHRVRGTSLGELMQQEEQSLPGPPRTKCEPQRATCCSSAPRLRYSQCQALQALDKGLGYRSKGGI
jgi:hypothetical protein